MSEQIITPPTPAPVPESPPARTFTQEEVDAIVGKRLSKAMKGIPSDEELTAYRSWKADRAEDQRKETAYAQTQADLDAAKAELEQLKREKYVLSKGLTGDDAEFVAFKAAKLVDDKTTYEQAVDQIVSARSAVKFDWTAPLNGGGGSDSVNNAMNNLIRGAIK